MFRVGHELTSTALKGDAWHHRSDAISSAAAFIGIAVALVGSQGYENADDWAALFACAFIVSSGSRIFRAALEEIIDAAVPEAVQKEIRELSASVPGVVRIEKCHARKSGLGVLVEIHVEVESELTVRRGRETGHAVNAKLNCLLPAGRRRLRLFSPPDGNPRSCQLHPEAVLRYTSFCCAS